MRKLLLFITIFLYSTGVSYASYLYFDNENETISSGDVFYVDININSKKEINAASGEFFFDKNLLEVVGISTDKSIFNLWTDAPSFNNVAGFISFGGGTAAPFSGDGGKIMGIYLKAKETGEATIESASGFSVFLNDGLGTPDDFTYKPFIVTIGKSDGAPLSDIWKNALSGDTVPPEVIFLKVEKNENIFDGKYFLSFEARDSGLGIEKVEVREGRGQWNVASNPYLINDQGLKSEIEIRFTDKAGNFSISKIPAEASYFSSLVSVVYILLFIIAIGGIIILWYLRKK